MKKLPLILALILLVHAVHAQMSYKMSADSVYITNGSKPAELNLENSTKSVKGFLYNKGNGRTEFRKVMKLNDSTLLFGDDSVALRGGYAFSNGISQSGSGIKLGGQLTEPVTLAVASESSLTIIGGGASQSLLNVTSGSAANAITAQAGTGFGIYAKATDTGIPLYVSGGNYGIVSSVGIGNGNGTSIEASSRLGKVFSFAQKNFQSTNDITTIGLFKKEAPSLTPADGYGLALDFNLQSTVTDQQAGRFVYKWTTASENSRTSALEFFTVNNTVLGRKAMLAGNGQWTWDGYAGLTAQDTALYKPLAIDDSGRVVKMTRWAGSGSGSTTTLQQITNAGNSTTKYINADSGYYQKGAALLYATDSMLQLGYNAGIANTTGQANTAIGNGALQANNTGGANTAIGYSALKSNTVSSGNVAVGSNALKANNGMDNSALGSLALLSNTNGIVNTAIGFTAMMNNTTGSDNTVVGAAALRSNTTGHFNNVVGANALLSINATGNNAFGWSAMQNSTSGNYNTAIGDSVMWSNGTGAGNVALGKNAGYNITTGSRNIAVGYKADVPSATASNQLSIGNLIYGTGLDGAGATVSNGKIGIKTQAPAYELDVNGKLGIRSIDSTASAANVLYQDAATGEIKKAALPVKQSFAQTNTVTINGIDEDATLIGSGVGSLTIPAAAWYVGKTYRITVKGFYSTDADNPAGIGFKIILGSTVIAQTTGTWLGANHTDIPFDVQVEVTCRATGSTGSVVAMGAFNSGDQHLNNINNGPNAATVDLSGNQTLNITARLSDGSAGNKISAFIVLLEAVN